MVDDCDNMLGYNTDMEPRFLDSSCTELYTRTLNLIVAYLIRQEEQLITICNRFSPLLGLV